MKRIKQFVLALLHRFHLEYLPEWRHDDYVLSVALRRVFDQNGVDLVLDVGANKGQYARFLRQRVGYAGLIHSFEPTPSLAAHLRTMAKDDPNWIIHECAVGDSDGNAELKVTRNSQLNSLLAPVSTEDLPASYYANETRVEERVVVQVKRLDNILDELQSKVDFKRLYVKIDTQGYDLCVMRGMGKWFEDVAAIQTELSFKPIYHGAESYLQSLQFLESRGFSLSDVCPVARATSQCLIEADGIFVRAV